MHFVSFYCIISYAVINFIHSIFTCSDPLKNYFSTSTRNEFGQADTLIGIADSLKQVHLDVIKHIKQPQFTCFYFNYHYWHLISSHHYICMIY